MSPFQSALAIDARHAAMASPMDATRERPILLHFAGALDVCCIGLATRCAVGQLMVTALGTAPDVLIRPQMPLHRSLAGPCLLAAVRALLARYDQLQRRPEAPPLGFLGKLATRLSRDAEWGNVGNLTQVSPLPHHPSLSTAGGRSRGGGGHDGIGDGHDALDRLTPHSHGASLSTRLLRETEAEMVQSIFCLVPAGDSAITDRTYTAIAAGCIPVVVADECRGAFSGKVRYEDWWVRVHQRDFIRHPERILAMLRSMSHADVRRRQQLLRLHAADVLYDAPDSRVGTNFLDDLNERCIPFLQNRTSPPKSGQKWLRRCLMQSGSVMSDDV